MIIDFIHYIETVWSTISNSYAIAVETLLVTIAGIVIALIAYRHQIAMLEPWTMTKVGPTVWLLQRNIPSLATVCCIALNDGQGHRNIVPVSSEEGHKIFRKGTNKLIDTRNYPALGTTFELSYENHKSEKKALAHRCEPTRLEDRAKAQSWITTLY